MQRDIETSSGRVVLRSATPQDALALCALERALAEDGRGMVLVPEQVDTPAQKRKSLERERMLPRDCSLRLVALHDDNGLVAEGTCQRLPMALCRHVGVLSLGVHPVAQGQGVGRALFKELIAWAREVGLLRLELYVRADNDRARSLYESLGFVVEHVRRNFVQLPDGTFVDDVLMVHERFDDAVPPRLLSHV